MIWRCLTAALAVLAVLGAAPANGAPPPNDSPAGAGVFSAYTAPNGTPAQSEAVAELVEATADPGVPRCLGADSFARTVWYRIPEALTHRRISVEAIGATTAPLDLAAFVQPDVPPAAPAPTPIPTRQAPPQNYREPNACDGIGAGAGGDSPDRVPGLTMLVPATYPVLIQVGRRAPTSSSANERAIVTVETQDVELAPKPRGDNAGSATPRLREGSNFIDLAGATLTDEDPAQPPCPSLGTVWRRLIPGSTGKRLISVSGLSATTLTVFSGGRPTGDNALDCVNRETAGKLQMVVPVRRGRTVWVRVGTDEYIGDEEGVITVSDGELTQLVDGGSGGSDPTPGGPGAGFPSACNRGDATRAAVRGSGLRGRASMFNQVTRITLKVRSRRTSTCDATLRLYGPGGHLYAQGRAVALTARARRVELPRYRTFLPGRYRLEVTGVDARDDRVRADTELTGLLRSDPRRKRRR